MPLLARNPPRQDAFPPTLWSGVKNLSADSSQRSGAAWEELIKRYRAPLLAQARRLLSRGRGYSASLEDAEDLLQSFWAACLEKDWLGRADPNRGRFRAFVQVLLKYFAGDRLDHEHAAKRYPEGGLVSLDSTAADQLGSVADAVDDAAFDREWVQVAIGRAIAEVEAESARNGIVLRDLLRTDGKGSRDLAEILGVHPQQLSVIKYYARRKFAKHFAAQLAATVRDPADFEEEWRALSAYLP